MFFQIPLVQRSDLPPTVFILNESSGAPLSSRLSGLERCQTTPAVLKFLGSHGVEVVSSANDRILAFAPDPAKVARAKDLIAFAKRIQSLPRDSKITFADLPGEWQERSRVRQPDHKFLPGTSLEVSVGLTVISRDDRGPDWSQAWLDSVGSTEFGEPALFVKDTSPPKASAKSGAFETGYSFEIAMRGFYSASTYLPIMDSLTHYAVIRQAKEREQVWAALMPAVEKYFRKDGGIPPRVLPDGTLEDGPGGESAKTIYAAISRLSRNVPKEKPADWTITQCWPQIYIKYRLGGTGRKEVFSANFGY